MIIIMQGNVTNVGFRPVVSTTSESMHVPTVKLGFALDVRVMEEACFVAMVVTSVPVGRATVIISNFVMTLTPCALNVMLKRRSLRRRISRTRMTRMVK